MKTQTTVRCRCGNKILAEANGSESFPDIVCPACNMLIRITAPLYFSEVGVRVKLRSKAELESGDFTLSIILSAMAVECELAFLFFWWKRMDRYRSDPTSGISATQAENDLWENEYRSNYIGIVKKLNGISKLLTGSDLDSFTGNGMTKHFEECLFWKRNQIVHFGKMDFGKEDAEKCYSIASTLFNIMYKMQKKCDSGQVSYRKNREG